MASSVVSQDSDPRTRDNGMKRHGICPDRRMRVAMIASGALLLLQGCPVNFQGLLAGQAQQILANTVFFLLDAVVVRAT